MKNIKDIKSFLNEELSNYEKIREIIDSFVINNIGHSSFDSGKYFKKIGFR